jgi:hypothetical protein
VSDSLLYPSYAYLHIIRECELIEGVAYNRVYSRYQIGRVSKKMAHYGRSCTNILSALGVLGDCQRAEGILSGCQSLAFPSGPLYTRHYSNLPHDDLPKWT